MFALFGTFFLSVLLGSHYYLYRRLRSSLSLQGRRARRAALGTLGFLATSFPLSYALLYTHYCATTCTIHWLAAVWVGLFLYLFLFSLLGHLLVFALRVSRLVRSETVGKIRRLSFLLGVAAAATVTGWGIYEARCRASITRVEIPVPDLPDHLAGMTIAQISDVHVGAIIGTERLEEIVDQVNTLDPDLIVITGDLVDRDAGRFSLMKAPLRRLRSRLGVFAVTGNHEYLANVHAAVGQAGAAGIRFLRNERVTLDNGVLLYGVDDPTGRRMGHRVPEIEEVVGAEASRAIAILLYHRPVRFERAASLGIDLMLSGHTHQGQLWPLTFISRIPFPRQYGLFRHRGSHLFVSRGVGTWGPPMRVGAPPEVVLITLNSGQKTRK
jgi:predicted MPP superfamily phosphohydrolase